MKTLSILIVVVVVFCLIGNPGKGASRLETSAPTLEIVRWIIVEEDQDRISGLETTTPTTAAATTPATPDQQPSSLSHQCSCERGRIQPPDSGFSSETENSTCDQYSTGRGPNQRVVSYSFYGDLSKNPEVGRKYFSQIGQRAEEVKSLYPGQ